MEGQMKQDFNIVKINNTNGAQVAGGQIQLIIPANLYSTESQIMVQYNGTGLGLAAANTICYRPDMAFIFNGQCTVQWDGLQTGLWQNLCVEQKQYYDTYLKETDVTSQQNAGTFSNQKWRAVAIGLGAGQSQVIKVFYPITQFLAGLYDHHQKAFRVVNQLTITINVPTVTDILGQYTTASGPSSTIQSISCTSVQLTGLMKILIDPEPVPEYIRIYQQYKYSNTTSANAVQTVGPDRICDKQSLAFCTANGNIFTLDNFSTQAATFNVTKNGYQLIQASDLLEAKAMMAMAKDDDTSVFNNLFAIYENQYSNISIYHNIVTSSAVDIYLGYWHVVQMQ